MLLTWLLRVFFRELYTRLSWAYDGVAQLTSIGQWFDWQTAALGYLRPGRVLEIAFGTGHILQTLAEDDYPAFGVDPSAQMAALASRRLRRHGHALQIARAEAQHLPFADQSFDCALSTFPSEFIFEAASLGECWRVLKSSGRIIVVPMAEVTGLSVWDRWAGWLYRVTRQSGPTQLGWADPFRRAGFQVEVHAVALPRAKVAVITGDKPALPPPKQDRRAD